MSNPYQIPADAGLQARRAAASKYRPQHVRTLLVAEAPPKAPLDGSDIPFAGSWQKRV